MKLVVNGKSETPLYQQLYNQFVSQIASGVLQENQCLPSIRNVAKNLEISVIPVKNAYELLEQHGYIYTLQGKGCFVAKIRDNKACDLSADKLKQAILYCIELGLEKDKILQIVQNCLRENGV